jgi:hypothetical protein
MVLHIKNTISVTLKPFHMYLYKNKKTNSPVNYFQYIEFIVSLVHSKAEKQTAHEGKSSSYIIKWKIREKYYISRY